VATTVLETGSHHVAQTGLELEVLLVHSPKGWDYRHEPPYWAQEHSWPSSGQAP
jgi:hypothetical protein